MNEKIAFAQAAIDAHKEAHRDYENDAIQLTDLLTDLMHWSRHHRISWQHATENAWGQFVSEVKQHQKETQP